MSTKTEYSAGPCGVLVDDHVYFDVPAEVAFAPETSDGWRYNKGKDAIEPMTLNRQQRRALKHNKPERFR